MIRRFERIGNLPDILEAIAVLQQAVHLTPNGHAYMPALLNNLGISFACRFERTGDFSDVSEAIAVHQRAVQLTPNGNADMPDLLDSLGNSLLCRFTRTSDLSDVSEAISVQQRAVKLALNGHANMPAFLSNLGNSFRCRFEHTGNVSDVTEAISVQQQAVQLTPNGHANMPGLLNNLGNSFLRCFKRTGDVSDLSEAISVHQQAVQLTQNGHSSMPGRLNNLGNSFLCRFECTGDVADISEAISVQQRAVQLTPNGHANISACLSSLGNSFRCRFERTGDVSDISEAISVLQQAVQLTPNNHTSMPGQLTNIGNSFLRRFERFGNVADLSEGISVHQRAVHLTPNGHANMSSWLNNLGNSFHCRFERTGDVSDLSEAISVQQQAVQLTPNGHANMPTLLDSLGNSFLYRFERTGDVSDISKAISVQKRAVQITPNRHAAKPGRLNNLGNSFHCRFERTGDISDVYTAISTFQMSATTFGPPSIRLVAAQKWARLSKIHRLPQTLTAFSVVLDLIAQIAGLDRTIQQRHTNLTEISSLTSSAASAAFTLGHFEKALEWLEQGRCLVWSQLNQLRTPLDDLHAHDEDLAQRFSAISGALETSGSRHGLEGLSGDASLSQKMSLQDEAHLHIKLAREWSKLLDEIRSTPRFRDFLRPPRPSHLLKNLPQDGIVILLNVDKDRCDALALISGIGDPMHIALDFTYDEASQLRERLRHFLSGNGVRMRGENRGPRPVMEEDSDMRSEIHLVLGALWLRVVRPILDALAYRVSVSQFTMYHFVDIFFSKTTPPSDPARIWWCPTGPLAFLPLHAAGIYSANERPPPGLCISDFAISSYTPTVTSLIQKFKESANAQQAASSRLLIISQPNTPGRSPIPATTKEMNCIWERIGASNGEALCLEGESASVNRVKLEMESHESIHLACHAIQHLENPLKSGFYLHDGRLELSEIMKQKFSVCELAFLSACQTSTGAEKLSDEAVHLAAGMLAAGYRSVVATMWSIKDRYGPVVAESFYKYLMEKGKASGKPGIDSSGAAHALHYAIQDIREMLGDTEQGLLTWVPYVHFGY